MSACPDENALAMLAEGGIDATARSGIEAHLDGCASCSELVAELASLSPVVLPPRYRPVKRLGAGAMGEVWEAFDVELSRRVAVKRVVDAAAGEAGRARLVREAKALAQLKHPNVLAVHDIAVFEGEVFVALELVEGATVRAWLATPRSPSVILEVWRQAAAGLSAVHRAGMVHRDVKPDNVFVAGDGRVVLGDFGLATGEVGPVASTLTETGAVVGTPVYMAPEQLQGEPASAASDQFALATSVWESLAGARPFEGKTAAGLALAMTRAPAPPSPSPVFATLLKALSFEPSERFSSVDAFVAALDTPVAPRPKRWGVVVGALAVSAAVSASLVVATNGSGSSPSPSPSPSPISSSPPSPSSPSSPSPAPPPTSTVVASHTISEDRRTGSGSGSISPPIHSPTPKPAAPREIPVQPAPPAPPPVEIASWSKAETDITAAILARDPKTCLAYYDHLPTVPADKLEYFEDYRAMCTMMIDCAAGRAMFGKLADARHLPAANRDRTIEQNDTLYCALDSAPESSWSKRANYQLQIALASKHGCERIVSFADAHHIELASRPEEAASLRASCAVQNHDCTAARTTWNDAKLQPTAFDSAFPTCK